MAGPKQVKERSAAYTASHVEASARRLFPGKDPEHAFATKSKP